MGNYAALRAHQDKAELTEAVLTRVAGKAIREAAKQAMDTMGYVVIAQDGYIVKKFANGAIEKIKKLKTSRVRFIPD